MTPRFKLPVDFPAREAIAHPNPLAVVLPYLKALGLALWQEWHAARHPSSNS